MSTSLRHANLFSSWVSNLDLTSSLQDAFDELESKLYYAGLPSHPVLVYRTGTTPWEPPTDSNAHVLKELRPVFDHNIGTVWDDLSQEVCRQLDSVQVTWTSIDVVCFAEVGKKEDGPPVLWIGVKPQSLSRKDAHTAAVGCKQLLESYRITDVEVEFRESTVTQSAHAKLLEPVPPEDATANVHGPLTHALGLQIAVQATQHEAAAEGTGALYICDSNKLYILTAQHVVIPPTGRNNNPYEYRGLSHERTRKVIHLGPLAIQNIRESIEARIDHQKDAIAAQTGKLSSSVGNAKKRVESTLKVAEAAKKDLTQLSNEVREYGKKAYKRVLGHIIYSPPIRFGTGDKRYTEDWALIQLDRKSIEWRTFKGNVLDLGTFPFILSRPSSLTTIFRYRDSR